MIITQKDIDRFYTHVLGANENGCRAWAGCVNKKGYGQFHINHKVIPAHRFSWLINFGEIPDGLLVCHTCDTPSCVEYTHLWLGTDQDNADDKMKKHRHTSTKGYHMNCGEDHPKAKLIEDDVRIIRLSYFNGDATQRELAKDFGVSRRSIQNILSNINWKTIT